MGFTAKDRNAFFAKWFRTDAGGLSVAERLVAEHSDIEMHTRLPLIATLVAALVENNYTPTSRAEIYGQRLELLLERWETVKGLRRSTVPRKSQLRFLKHLAMIVLDRQNRSARFGWDELRQAFAKGLGAYGDDLDPSSTLVSARTSLNAAGFPATDRTWTPNDYAPAYEALEKLVSKRGDGVLPRAGSARSGAVFSRMIDRGNFAVAADRSLPVEARLPIVAGSMQPLTGLLKLYLRAALRPP
jgi:hypothetical protein